jgi:hypothetical protein
MENNNILKYKGIELEYHPPEESFEFYPNWGKKIREAYYTIRVWDDGFVATIQYINSDKVYLHAYRYVHSGGPKDVLEFTLYKINELKNFLKEKYNLDDEDIKIETYGIK